MNTFMANRIFDPINWMNPTRIKGLVGACSSFKILKAHFASKHCRKWMLGLCGLITHTDARAHARTYTHKHTHYNNEPVHEMSVHVLIVSMSRARSYAARIIFCP